MTIQFKPLAQAERDQLLEALRRNATDGAALRLNPGDTSFRVDDGSIEDVEVINAIKSVPCHYAQDNSLLDSDGGGNYKLRRSGQAPLAFSGEIVAESQGRRVGGKDNNRWHDITIYQTSPGHGNKYVVQIEYLTQWEGEIDHDFVGLAEASKDVATILEEYDPIAHVGGFPAGRAYDEKQGRLLATIRAHYNDQVSDVLASAEFAEPI